MRLHLAIATAAGLLLAGCGSMPFTGTDEAMREDLITARATVESVDTVQRSVRLRDAETGDAFTVYANDGIKNLEQLDAGDVVVLEYYEAVMLDLAHPADSGEAIDTIITAEAPEGAKPGGLTAVTTTVVVELVDYDAASGMASYKLPDGNVRRTVVKPEMRTFAAERQRGDRILVTMVEAVAATIEEVEG